MGVIKLLVFIAVIIGLIFVSIKSDLATQVLALFGIILIGKVIWEGMEKSEPPVNLTKDEKENWRILGRRTLVEKDDD